nr:MAG TPA: minor tail protein [Caudoviricetes sp.]
MELFVTLAIKDTAYKKGLKDAEGNASSSTSKIGGAFKTVGKVAKTAMAAGSAAAAAFTKTSIDSGMNFDTAMSQVAATMGTTVDKIGDVKAKAEEMGRTTKYTATEAAEGMNILAQAGLSADEQISGIGTVLNLASAGAMSLEESASYTAGAVKGFGDTMSNASYYADLMAKGATLANTDVRGLGEAFSGSAATAKNYGQAADGVTLSLLRLAEQNVTGSEASTALNRAMADLYTPTDDASKALNQLGVSAYEANGEAKDFNDLVDELNGSLQGMTAEQKNNALATIFTTQGLQAFNKMTASSDATVQKFWKGIQDSSGSAAQQAATQLDNLKGDITLLSSATEGLELGFYNTFSGTIRGAIKGVTSEVSGLAEAMESGGISAALSKLAQDAINFSGQLPGLAKVGGDLINGLISGIAQNSGGITSAVGQLLNNLASTISTGLSVLTSVGVNLLTTIASGMAQGIPNFLAQALPMLTQFSAQLRANAGQLIDAGLQLILNIAQGIANSLPTLITYAPQIVTNIANIINDNAPKLIATGLKIIVTLGSGIIQAIPSLIASIPQIIQAIVAVVTAFNWVSLGGKVTKGLASGIKKMLGSAKGAAKSVATGIKGALQSLPSTLKSLGSKGVQGLKSTFSAGVGALRGVAKNIVSAIAQAISSLPSKLLGFARKAVSDIKGAFKAGWSAVGKNVVSGIANGISGGVGAVISAAKRAAQRALSAAKSALGIHSPSRKFRDEVGKQIVAGMALGITKNTKKATSAGTKLANAVYKSVSKTQKKKSGKQFSQALVNAASTKVTKLKNSNKISEKQEALYWKTILKHAKKGTAAYRSALSKFTSAKKTYNKDVKKLNTTFKSDISNVQKQLISDIQAVVKTYDDAVTSRKDALFSATKLTSAFSLNKSTADMDADTILDNLQTHVDGLTDYSNTLEKIKKRLGKSNRAIYDDLTSYDVTDTGFLEAIANMTDKEFSEFVKLYNKKSSIALKEAVSENDVLKASTEAQIKTLIKNAGDQVQKLEDAYNKNLKKLGSKTRANAKKIGENIVKGISKGIKSQYSELNNAVKSIMNSVVSTSKKSLQIKSPSRVFANQVGKFIPLGIAQGIENNADSVYSTLSALSNNALLAGDWSTGYNAQRTAAGQINDNVSELLTAILELMRQYFPDFGAEGYDPRGMAKMIAPYIDRQLGQIQANNSRR